MSSKAPIRIGLPPNQRVLWIEREPKKFDTINDDGWHFKVQDEASGFWVIPLSTNPQRTLGEFLKLYDNGKVERVTLRADDDDAVVLIKPEDK